MKWYSIILVLLSAIVFSINQMTTKDTIKIITSILIMFEIGFLLAVNEKHNEFKKSK